MANLNLNNLVERYKGLLSGAGNTLASFIPPVQAVKSIKTMATPQWQQSIKEPLLSTYKSYVKSPSGELFPKRVRMRPDFWKKPTMEDMRAYTPLMMDIAMGATTAPTGVAKGVVKNVVPKTLKVSTKLQPELKPISQLMEETVPRQVKRVTKSLAQEANRAQSKYPGAEALPSIIARDAPDVNSKVGILDLVRTPDRVMKKIGLGKEMNLIRQKYNDYLDQLPKEINKITEWSKQVSPDGNRRIFQYLDGQDAPLSQKELGIAKDIKKYLSNWADKLGLPPEKRITNYITHIFEKDFIKKEFDPELAKLIQNRVAGSVYDPFVEQRLGKMGYVEDTWRALDAYVKRATRKVNMDVALEQVKDASKNLELSQYNYVKKYIDRINMRPTDIDNLVDNTIKQVVGYKFGQRPTTLLTRMGRQWVYRGTLGLNPGTAIKNLTQGANTYAKLGERYTIKGYWDIFTKGAKELEDVGVLRDQFIQDRTISAGKQLMQKLDKGLFVFFDMAEKINRGAAYYGAKARALAKGASEQEAIQEGLKMVRDTQFTFGSIDTPPILSSDIGKLLLQFQSFTIKQGEFLGEMISNKEFAGLIRYALSGLGMVYTVGKLIGMKPEDIIPSFRFGLPPTLKLPVEIGKSIIGIPDKYGNVPDTQERLQNIGKAVVPFIPAGTQIKKSVEGLTDVSKGFSETPKGLIKYPVEQNIGNYIRGGLFGRHNLPEAQEYYKKERTPLSKKQSELVKSEGKQTYAEIMEQRDLSKEEDKTRKQLEESKGSPQAVGNKILYWDSESGSVKTLNFSPITKPKITGQPELDKIKISSYNSKINAQIKNVAKLEELGQVTSEEAEKKIKELTSMKMSTSKKPKRITIKKLRVPKIKLAKVKKVKIPKPKKLKRYTLKTKKIKTAKIKLSKKLT